MKSQSQTRAALLAAAQALIAASGSADFSLKELCAKAGVGRAAFRRCFADRDALLAAMTAGEARALDAMLDAARPVPTVREAVHGLHAAGGGTMRLAAAMAQMPAQVPVTDAWLERRLRVFERALAGLESRQEKYEQALARQLAEMREQITGPVIAMPVFADPPVEKADEEISLLHPAPAARQIADVSQTEVVPSAAAPPDPPPPVSNAEMEKFLAHARRIAQKTTQTEPVPEKIFPQRRWLAWGGVAAVLLVLVGAGLALGHATDMAEGDSQPGYATSHRHLARGGIARLIARADSGDAGAQTALAFAYLQGQGVTDDDAAAKRWSAAAATQGQPVAQYLLGTLYLQGDGGAPDQRTAVRWFRAAAAQGNVKAMHNLAIAYAEGLGVDKDPVTAARWFQHAAQQGYRDSQFDLAVLYERGQGVPQSEEAALKWYLIAAAGGDAPSAVRAAFLRGQVTAPEAAAAAEEAAVFAPHAAAPSANKTPL